MINPFNCTNYSRTEEKLQEFAIFSVCVAGKRASHIATAVNNLLWDNDWVPDSHGIMRFPFAVLLQFKRTELEQKLQRHGIGCYKMKSKTLYELCRRGYDLRKVTPAKLEEIPGIGPKTSRFFVLHSQPNAQYAALDTHILHWLRDRGLPAPKSTPTGKRYETLEQEFLYVARSQGMTPAELDLEIWKKYTNSKPKAVS
jgi:hypothetical protein